MISERGEMENDALLLLRVSLFKACYHRDVLMKSSSLALVVRQTGLCTDTVQHLVSRLCIKKIEKKRF